MTNPGRVLSIQSHVAHGYVGNKAAVFPLQCRGWDVDVVNTVDFSNHTGYGKFRGTTMADSELQLVLSQLLNKLKIDYQAVITGYMPTAALVTTIGDEVAKIKQNRHLMYLLDPVMGDNGFLYVDRLCIDAYRQVFAKKVVDVMTPNQFELELLVDFTIDGPELLERAMKYCHDNFGVTYVVVLLVSFGGETMCAFSTPSTSPEVFTIPIIKLYFTGVGDLFSALLLDRLYCYLDLPQALAEVLAIMAKTLKMTHECGVEEFQAEHPGEEIELRINDGTTMKYFELRIIQAKPFFSQCATNFIAKSLA